MPAYSKVLGLLFLSVALVSFAGCGGTGSPIPASSSASSEAADAAGGVNKAPGSDAGAPNKGAESKDDASKDKEAKEAPAEEKK